VATAIDVHAHVIVEELLRDGAPAETWRPCVRRADGLPVVEFAGQTISSAVHEFVELPEILVTMERLAISRVVLSPWVPLLFYDVAAREALERCRLQNAGLQRLRDSSRHHVSVLGAVPLQDPELAAGELVDLMSSDAFAGVEVTTSVNGDYLGDSRFEAFWSAAEHCDALVFVHPTTRGLTLPVLDRHYLWNLVGNPIETTIAAADLVLSGTMARHPGLRVLLAHGGGAIVSLSGRIKHGQRTVTEAGPPPATDSDTADAMVRRFLFDSVTHDPKLLRALVEIVGADRVLLGSDYPFDMGEPDPVAIVQAAGLGEQAQRNVLAQNAERELRLGAGAGSSVDA
jgi:aminocarboxymuconate-semialdehyde decarboxylase